jgi:hypothetical protein
MLVILCVVILLEFFDTPNKEISSPSFIATLPFPSNLIDKSVDIGLYDISLTVSVLGVHLFKETM